MIKLAQGFTLVEVLIALLVLALTTGAYFGQLHHQTIQTMQLQNRSLSHWAMQQHLGSLRLPGKLLTAGTQTITLNQAGSKWTVEQQTTPTTQPDLYHIVLTARDQNKHYAGTLEGMVSQTSIVR